MNRESQFVLILKTKPQGRFSLEPHSMWHRVITSNLVLIRPVGVLLQVPLTHTSPWKFIYCCYHLFRPHIRYEVGLGFRVWFWEERSIGDSSLKIDSLVCFGFQWFMIILLFLSVLLRMSRVMDRTELFELVFECSTVDSSSNPNLFFGVRYKLEQLRFESFVRRVRTWFEFVRTFAINSRFLISYIIPFFLFFRKSSNLFMSSSKFWVQKHGRRSCLLVLTLIFVKK